MQNTNHSPEELNSTNENENNDNLQNNSEENIQNENVEKQKPKHVPGLIEKMLDEGERKSAEDNKEIQEEPIVPRRDPSVWDHRSDDEENKNEDNSKDAEPNSNNEVRDYKGSNRKLANKITARDQKQKKYDRLVNEMNEYKAELKRGYRIVEKDDGQVSHVPLTSAEKNVSSFKISDLDYKRFMVRIEIQGLDQKITQIATKKRTISRTKKNKVARSIKEDKLVQRVDKELSNAMKNGKQKLVSGIENQVRTGDNTAAYNSLKSFLSAQVKPVAKKLDKSVELEKNVLNRVIENISKAQS